MAGRPRKPTSLKLLKGTLRKHRMNSNEPTPEAGIPVPPEHVSDMAKAFWPEIAALLDRMGVLTEADGLALEGLCEAYVDKRKARAALDARGGLTYESATKNQGRIIRPFPETAMVADADRRLLMWLTKFGLSPADRSRVEAIGKQEPNPWDQFT